MEKPRNDSLMAWCRILSAKAKGSKGRTTTMHCVVYGTKFLCAFNQISAPLKQTIMTIIGCEYDSLDISNLMAFSGEINAEIESIGNTLVTLALELQETIYASHKQSNGGVSEAHSDYKHQDVNTDLKNNASIGDSICQRSDKHFTKSVDQSTTPDLMGIKASLADESQRNDKLEAEIEQLRVTQENCLTTMEERIKQAESTISERLQQRKLERRKEARQNILRKNDCDLDSSLKKDCGKYSWGSAVITRRSETNKREIQLKEEIKWSRITPLSVRGARSKNKHSLPAVQKKT